MCRVALRQWHQDCTSLASQVDTAIWLTLGKEAAFIGKHDYRPPTFDCQPPFAPCGAGGGSRYSFSLVGATAVAAAGHADQHQPDAVGAGAAGFYLHAAAGQVYF